MSQSAVQNFYRFHAHVYDSTRWMILHGRGRAAAALELRPNARVLEVGCGTGLNFRFLQQFLDQREGHITGLDFSADMLDRAEKRVDARGWSNVRLVQGDATTMDLGETYDAVYLAYSLTMIPEWPAALERSRAHLRPGGTIVVLDFSRFHGWGPLAPAMRTWLRLNHVETRRPYEDEFCRVFDDATISYWLGGYNFTAIGRRGS